MTRNRAAGSSLFFERHPFHTYSNNELSPLFENIGLILTQLMKIMDSENKGIT